MKNFRSRNVVFHWFLSVLCRCFLGIRTLMYNITICPVPVGKHRPGSAKGAKMVKFDFKLKVKMKLIEISFMCKHIL